ncbi:hypothetical protein TELCIR_14904 [Teladorsagia circumcincta]|uniref:VWFA domain-containing protein n=1 Tax=Teladorsagia circumcincta TaxID=45464 RepID=A0A2G9TZW1_TELCI|nr:hypothetical protein TELCIR_14904 [Teladorsagia circumcincta]
MSIKALTLCLCVFIKKFESTASKRAMRKKIEKCSAGGTKATLPTDLPKEKGTAQALELGKKILESETRKHKVVLMISDGRKTTCPKDKPKDDEIKIAEVLRKLGIKIVYSATGKNPDKNAIAEITGDPKLTITLGDLICFSASQSLQPPENGFEKPLSMYFRGLTLFNCD